MIQRIQALWVAALVGALLFVPAAVAQKLPSIVVLATGGTIAGAAASDVQAGYTSGQVGVDQLLAAVPQAKKGIICVRSTRVTTGRVGRNVEMDDDKLGLIASDKLNPQKSRVLLRLALLKQHSLADIKLQVVYGKGVENYMNDAPQDVGAKLNLGNPKTPLTGVALPLVGIVAFYDHYWSDRFSSSVGYSRVDVDNSDAQADNAFKSGQYALTNLLYYPVKDVMVGGEFQFGHRKNARDGWSVPDYRIQFSFRHNFSFRLGG